MSEFKKNLKERYNRQILTQKLIFNISFETTILKIDQLIKRVNHELKILFNHSELFINDMVVEQMRNVKTMKL